MAQSANLDVHAPGCGFVLGAACSSPTSSEAAGRGRGMRISPGLAVAAGRATAQVSANNSDSSRGRAPSARRGGPPVFTPPAMPPWATYGRGGTSRSVSRLKQRRQPAVLSPTDVAGSRGA